MSQAQETTSSIGSTFWSGDTEHPKWPDICNLVPASPSWTFFDVVIRSKHNREVAKNTKFVWEAWAVEIRMGEGNKVNKQMASTK